MDDALRVAPPPKRRPTIPRSHALSQDVKFPMRLDVFDLCADDLKEKLRPMREKFAAYQDWEAEQQASVRSASPLDMRA